MPDGTVWRKKPSARLTPRPHQVDAIAAVTACLSKKKRATLMMACASGKTLVGIFAAYELLPKSGGIIVVLFPSLGLIWQTQPVWRRNWPGQPYNFMAVCSDKKGKDEIRPDAWELGFDVTTNQHEVEGFLSRHKRGLTSVIFVTYQSAPIVGRALLASGKTASIAIFDEAHRTAGGIDKAFGYALKDERFPITRRLFMTATPRIAKRWQKHRTRSGGEEFPVVSMDDKSIYGEMPVQYTFSKAVSDGIICPYKIMISVVKKSELRGVMPEEDEAALIALRKGMERTGAKKVISYHDSIAAADAFADAAGPVLGGLTVVHVNGDQSGPERRERMGAFGAAERALATNMKCLTEGIDVPDIDMVAFMAPKNSSIDIVQAVGRAQRRHPGKRVGYVLLPLLLDIEAGETVEEAVARKKMQTVWRVISAMMDMDPLFAEAVRARRQQQRMGGPITRGMPSPNPPTSGGRVCGAGSDPLSGLIDVSALGADNIDGQQEWPVEVLTNIESWDALRTAIDVSIVDHVRETWNEVFSLLEAYVARTGSSRLPWQRARTKDEERLDIWMQAQRYKYATGVLRPELASKLESLPNWSWHPQTDVWDDRFSRLKEYVARTGSACVPTSHHEDGFRLGEWIVHQRRQRGAYPERDQKLEALPGWSWNAIEDSWESWFSLYQSYIARTGSSRILNKHREDGKHLGAWVMNQRVAYKSGRLDLARIKRLEALPDWAWNPRIQYRRTRKKKCGGTNNQSGLRRCPECSATHPDATVCFECGHVYEADERPPEVIYQDIISRSGYRRGYERATQFMRRADVTESTYLRWRKQGFPVSEDGWINPSEADAFMASVSFRPSRAGPEGFECRAHFAKRIGSIRKTVTRMVERGLPCDPSSGWINIKQGLEWVKENEPNRAKIVKRRKKGPIADKHLFERITDFARRVGVTPPTIANALRRGIPHDPQSGWIKIKEGQDWFASNYNPVYSAAQKARKQKPAQGFAYRGEFAKMAGLRPGSMSYWVRQGLPTGGDSGAVIPIAEGLAWISNHVPHLRKKAATPPT